MVFDPRIGSTLAGYRILDVLGRGGMGVVYLAEDETLGRRAAIKVLAAELAGERAFRDRFVAESRLAASIDHPSIVPIYEAGEADGTLFIAMRFVDGDDLRAILEREGLLEPDRLARLLASVADALDAAHAVGLVHRDVKPGNILVSRRDDHPYLTDFGLSRRLAAERLTASGVLVGTPDYIAPEQVVSGRIDGRADQYSLACIVFEALAGKPPLERGSDLETVLAHLQEDATDIREVRPDLPEALTDVVGRGLARDPAGRYPDCRTLIAAVIDALAPDAPGRGVGATQRTQPAEDRSSEVLGREGDIDQVEGLLADGARLVTLTGPGGVGKTTLCRELLERARPAVHGPVVLVELEAVRGPDLVPAAVAAALGGEGDAAVQLGDTNSLLGLDNLEHLLGAAPWVGDLLRACAGLRVIATSREPLRIGAERVHPVGPLDEEASRDLFLKRARLVRPDVVSSPAVDAVCARLDRLPLAIELAAARTSLLSPDALLSRLERALDVLATGPRDRSDRQRTLRSTIAWSYELLDPDLRGVFRRTAVFVNGFGVEAAEVVAGATLDDLDKVVSGSLVAARYDADEPRFHLLETIRAFARERLDGDPDEADATRRAHAAWALDLVERVGRAGRGNEPGTRMLTRELDNLRAALAWSSASGDDTTHWRIATGLSDVWQTRGHLAEARSWLEPGLPEASIADDLRAEAYDDASTMAFRQGQLDDARRLAERQLDLARALGQPRRTVAALAKLAQIALRSGDPDGARALHAEAFSIAEHDTDRRPLMVSLSSQANADLLAGRVDLATEGFEQSLRIAQEVDLRPESVATAYYNLGLARAIGGTDPARARDALREALRRYAAMEDREGVGYVLVAVAALLIEADPRAAARALGASAEALASVDATLEVVEAHLRITIEERLRAGLGPDGLAVEIADGAARSPAEWLEMARAALA